LPTAVEITLGLSLEALESLGNWFAVVGWNGWNLVAKNSKGLMLPHSTSSPHMRTSYGRMWWSL